MLLTSKNPDSLSKPFFFYGWQLLRWTLKYVLNRLTILSLYRNIVFKSPISSEECVLWQPHPF